MDMYGFYMGWAFDAYEDLGAHADRQGVLFRTYAPSAEKVSLLLEGRELPMKAVYDGNFYELRVPQALPGDRYEYRIYAHGGYTDHCDPYGFQTELRPAHRSVVCDPAAFSFHDEAWMRSRVAQPEGPMNIYEVHLGSWRRKTDGTWYRYDELAEPLARYLTGNGYNWVELMPLTEYPADESWGYQTTGYFAPTSRYGTPVQLKMLIDTLHCHGIGVLLDFVPVHFAQDAWGLARYDGSCLYEYPHPDVGVSEWGSCNFMHSRGEVRSFLQSSAHFWLSEYHFDGLRMDAVSRMIYWQGDEKRGVNGNALDFLKVMNRGLKERHPGCILIAEDSTDYAGVTLDVEHGGLGFDYKWDMGWMHDTLAFFQTPSAERPALYHRLTFSMLYFYKERYLLPFSHDETVHGKKTVLDKMNGPYDMKFPQARALYLYMMVHPGKKLNFMGAEIGQLREWDERREQDWDLLKYPIHDAFHHYMAELNRLYLTHSALWEREEDPASFQWLDCHQETACVYIILRTSHAETMVAGFNFSEEAQTASVPVEGSLPTVVLDTDWEPFGGHTVRGQTVLIRKEASWMLSLPPFSGVLLACEKACGQQNP